MMCRRYRPALVAAVAAAVLSAAGPVGAQAPAGQAQPRMKMADMDHRGGIRGTVRGANNAPVATRNNSGLTIALHPELISQ